MSKIDKKKKYLILLCSIYYNSFVESSYTCLSCLSFSHIIYALSLSLNNISPTFLS